MRITTELTDKLIVFTCCLMLYLTQDELGVSVVIVLVSVIFSGFQSYFDSTKIRTVMTVGFCILAFFMPGLFIFFPLSVYDMLFHQYQYFNLIVLIPSIYAFQFYSMRTGIIVLSVILVSALLKYRMKQQEQLHAKHNQLIDSAREMSNKLEKQNRDLIEKQDYELNVATLNERNRIAREIHDNVGHLLSSAILQSGALLTVNRDEKVTRSLKTLNETLNQAMNSIRTSVHELYEESLDLNIQIHDLIKNFTFCELNYDYKLTSNPDKKLKYAFIAVIREALSNIIKHSNATRVSIILQEHPALYQMIIRDNGLVKKYASDEGLGLKNMADRVMALNGNIHIMTEKGFEIFVSVPKEVVYENTDHR